MSSVENYLVKKYGRIDKTWNIGLQVLADNLDRYYQMKEQIDADGIWIKAKNGACVKHPLLAAQKEVQGSFTKLLDQFGLTPRSADKILKADPVDDTDKLKDLLING